MKKFLNKARSSFQDSSSPGNLQKPLSQSDEPSTISPPTPLDVLRYRYHHGTNLGSVFVLEQWLSGSMYPQSSSGGSELDAVSATLKSEGLQATRSKWENHWQSAVPDSDFEWLINDAKCTSIRLPIGYFTLGKNFCQGTPYEHVAEVYDGAWNQVKTFVARARSFGIGTLLDFHALPGGANGDAHSGTSTGKADFWGHKKNTELATRCLIHIAQEVRSGMDGVIGIQLVNEAVWDGKGMYGWYDDVISQISQVDDSIPIYISDGWDLNRALGWTNGRHLLKKGGPRNPVIVDTHKYYTFSDADRSQAPQQIISRIPNELGELGGKSGSLSDHGEGEVIVGEYSCVLDGQTWGRVRPEEKDGLVRQFGREQSAKWQQNTGGSYFWTYKMEWMDGGEWGFAEQTKKQNIVPPQSLTLAPDDVNNRVQNAQGRRGELLNQGRGGHEDYWNKTSPGKHFEHERYGTGWDTGFSDAVAFFAMRADGGLGRRVGIGGDKIGCLDAWIKKRLVESGQRGQFVWEWEQGYRAGVSAFYSSVGV